MYVIGRGRYARETYPEASRGAPSVDDPSWVTAVDIDWTSLPAQTLAADGVYPIPNGATDGVTPISFIKTGSVFEAAPMAIVPGAGQGLIVQPDDGGFGPLLFTPLYSLVPVIVAKWSTRFRVWLFQTQNNANSDLGTAFREILFADFSSGDGPFQVLQGWVGGAGMLSGYKADGGTTIVANGLAAPGDAETGPVSCQVFEADLLSSAVTNYVAQSNSVEPDGADIGLVPFLGLVPTGLSGASQQTWGDPTGAGSALTFENVSFALGVTGSGQANFVYGLGRLVIQYKE